MDWLEAHKVKLDCYNKTFECMDEEGNPVVVKGIPKVISVRQVSAMQLNKFCRKGFQLYESYILEPTGDQTPRLEDYQLLQEFEDVFPDEIPGLLSRPLPSTGEENAMNASTQPGKWPQKHKTNENNAGIKHTQMQLYSII